MATAEEAKKTNVEKMGAQLGVHYSALWQEVALLYRNWGEYSALFGTKPSRIELMNRAAPYFFAWCRTICSTRHCFTSRDSRTRR
jgi:hypothetical protein